MTVTVTANVTKVCPYREELDSGQIDLVFENTEGDMRELHSIRQMLDAYSTQALSHEEFTRLVIYEFGAVRASSRWTTAGMTITCEATS